MLRQLLGRAVEKRGISLASGDPRLIQLLGGWGPTAAGVLVDEESALRLTAVWSAVSLESSTVAGLPLKVWKDRPDGFRVAQKNTLFDDPMNAELDMTWFEGIEFMVSSLMRYGNSYSFKVRNDFGDRVIRLIPMLPCDVYPYLVQTKTGPAKRFRVNGVADDLTPADILHIPGLAYDGVIGYSPVQVAREALGAAIAAEEAGARLFNSGLLNGGVLQTDQELDETQADLTKQRWQEKVAGVARAYEVAVLDRGLKWQQTTLPPKDAQWLEARQFGVAEVARIFRQPPALLFEYMGTGNVDADKLGAQWLRFGLNQTLKRIEKRLSLHLLPRGQFCEFDRYGLLEGTPKEQAEVEQIQVESGVLTKDEARALHNRPPLPKPETPPPAAETDPTAEDDAPPADNEDQVVNAD